MTKHARTCLKKALTVFTALIIISALTACSHQPTSRKFNINHEYSSANYDDRVRQIVLHYAAENFYSSLKTLEGKTDNQVSCHYTINRHRTSKNPDYIYNLVPDSKRSWHAGISQWGKAGLIQ